MGFREDFLWGVATSAYQIEGAQNKLNKGLSIWDVYVRENNKIYDGHTGDIACNHIQTYKEDVKMMKDMGIKSYRFSIDWSRVIPDGYGNVNEEGMAFYDSLINERVKAQIVPCITLYPWELPYEIYKKGGWLNEDIVQWFGRYAGIIAERFSDRVKFFFTINEPQCFIGLGYLNGVHAPGLKVNLRDTFEMAHNVMKAHGRAVQMIREKSKRDVLVGYAPTCGMTYPYSNSKEDIEATRKVMFSIPEADNWTWNISWWSDPVILGKYPEEGLMKYEQYLPKITEEDMKLISEPIDIYGQNIYNGRCIRMGEDGRPVDVKRKDGYARTANNWPVTPECLYWGPKFLYERYKKPIYITENGMSAHDVISKDSHVHDDARIEFTRKYLSELKKASEDGVDIRGYFHWSLMDNFEWDKGYSERFGLVYVDYETQQRVLKDSAYWYKDVIKNNGNNL